MSVCEKHHERDGDVLVQADDCTVCRGKKLDDTFEVALQRQRKVLKRAEREGRIRLTAVARAGYLLAPVDPSAQLQNVAAALEMQDQLSERLDHALAALRHIARTCIDEPDTAQFALCAALTPPNAYAPEQDYEEGTYKSP